MVSGDKDFIPVVLEMRGKGVRVEVAAFDSNMARELALKSSGYINLDYWLNEAGEIVVDAEENFDEDDKEFVTDKEEKNGNSNC